MPKESPLATRRVVLAGTAVTGLGLAGALIAASEPRKPNMSRTATVLPTNLFLLEDLGDSSRTRALSQRDLTALRAIGDWVQTFVVRPNANLGRTGPVCPFVPKARDNKALWLAPERFEGRDVSEIVDLVSGYKKLFSNTEPTSGDDAAYKSLVVVFADLPLARAKDFFNELLQHVAKQAYEHDGLVIGAFYEGNDGTALYNPSFKPFRAPAPFLLIRPAVVSDWKFFLDDDTLLALWARRFKESAVQALAAELRRQPWRTKRE
jgi:hypothetical protein